MASKLKGLGTGAASGAGLGAGLGSIVGPWGTAIGGAVGAIGGGIAGYLGAGDEQDQEDQQALDDQAKRDRALRDAQDGGARAKAEAYQRFIMGEAERRGANPTLLAQRGMQMQQGDIDYQVQQRKRQLEEQAADAQTARQDNFDPMALAPLAAAAGNISQNFYRAGQETPFYLKPETATSPEVQKEFDESDWAPLRQGRRMGYGQ